MIESSSPSAQHIAASAAAINCFLGEAVASPVYLSWRPPLWTHTCGACEKLRWD